MSNSGKGKNKRVNSKSGSKKSLGSNQSSPYEGAYGNPRLVHVLLSLMGAKCQASVRNGGVYEGLLHTFNPKMDVALNVVHMCNTKSESHSSTNGIDEQKKKEFPKEEELIQQMMFQTENLVSLKFEDVDLDYAISDVNETNGEAVREQRTSLKQGEKKLEPWDGGGDSLDKDSTAIGGLEGSGGDGTNGWDANEMFRANEEIYGVKSDYDSSLSSYTMRLDIQEEDPEKVARATRLAQEIESGTDYKQRIDLEVDDGTTEEDKFSAVVRDRDMRRGPRDIRDRDGEHGGYRDKDKPWGDRDRDRDHPLSPQGYRTGKHEGYDRYRGRGRGRDRDRDRDTWIRGNQQGYPGPNMGPNRSMGPGPPMSGGGGRNQPPMSQMDGHPGQGGQGKHRNSSSSQLPPRFTKSGSGGYSRGDGEGMRHQNENNAMHSTYSAPKGQRPNRKSSSGRMHPTTDFTRHSPTQMYSDPAASGGGPPLSRTSSSSSNASAPVQNHRKLLSTSSQEDQPPQIPSQQHHQHMRQAQSSSSPTGGPMIPSNQPPQQRPQTIPPAMPGQQDAPSQSWASIASRNPKPQMAPSASDISPSHMGQGLPQQSPGANKISPVVVNSNQKFSWAPSPGNAHYPQQGMQPQMQGNSAASSRMVQTTPGAMNRGQPQPVTSPPQRQPQHYGVPMQARPGQRMVQPGMKPQTGEPLKHDADKTEDTKQISKKMPDLSSIQNTQAGTAKSREGMKELQEFRQNFKLASEVNKESPGQAPNKIQQRPQNISQQQRQQPYPNPVPHQQGYPAQPQTYAASMGMTEHSPQVPHQMTGAQGTNQPMPPKHMQPNQGMVMHHPQQMPQMTQQIPMASPSIQLFGAHSPVQASPRSMESPKAMGPRTPGGMQQKPLTSPQADMSNYPQGNVHVVTGPTVPQANPPAVISVSAATLSPIAPSQLQAVTANAQQHQTQSPTPGQVAPVSSTSSIESAGNISSTTPSSSVTSPTSAAKHALNPEAVEFKPRTTPSKSTAARATTPLQQQSYVAAAAYQPQGMGGMTPQGHLMAPVYHPGAIDHMQQQMPQHLYSQFPPQQIILGQQQIVQQQMQQFTPFDQGQVYANPGSQPMMAQNARIPAGPQQHMQQYPPDQPPAVYVQSNFMQPQARPHSAHTPTQVTHVTAASPAGQSAQQPPQPAGHHGPTMVPTHGAQQQMPVLMVQAGQIPPQHQPQMPPQFINVPTMPSAVPMAMQQPKGQQQPNQYMAAQPGRSYGPYPPPVPNTQ